MHLRFILIALVASTVAVLARNDGSWTRVQAQGKYPTPKDWRMGATLGNRLLVVGGEGNQNDTYAYDSTSNSWVDLIELPTKIKAGDMAVVGGNVFVFGGMSSGYINDVQMLRPSQGNNEAWKAIASTNPPPERNAHSATHIAGVLWVFGGWNGQKYFNDLWAVDTTDLSVGGTSLAWVNVVPDGSTLTPHSRNAHTVVAHGGTLILFGGFWHNVHATGHDFTHCSKQNDVCAYYDDVWTWTPPQGEPLGSISQTAKGWSRVQAVADPVQGFPAPRWGHTAQMMGDTMYVFGGNIAGLEQIGDLWGLSMVTNSWRVIYPAGQDRPGAQALMVSGVIANSMYIFGGAGSRDMWMYTPPSSFAVTSGSSTCPDLTCPDQDVDTSGIVGALVFNTFILLGLGIGFLMIWKKLGGSARAYKPMDESTRESFMEAPQE